MATADTHESPDKNWNYEVGYDPDSIFRYEPKIEYKKLGEIQRYRYRQYSSIVTRYPILSEDEYKMVTEGITKIKI